MVTRSKDLGEPLRWCLCITWSWARTITSSSPLSGPLHPEPRSQSQEKPEPREARESCQEIWGEGDNFHLFLPGSNWLVGEKLEIRIKGYIIFKK